MSTLSQFGGGAPTPKAIINGVSNAGFGAITSLSTFAQYANSATIGSGALTANTLKNIISVAGPGCLNFLSVHTNDVTSRTLRIKLALDGIVVFDYTSWAIATSGAGAIVIGSREVNNGAGLQPVYFKSSFVLDIASSLTETDKCNVSLNYFTS